ncbi:hypothetical protein X742_19680 [Mesorhizobium sp. LNHC232B00]|nr:hypothetical protein X742_19680 [Mesorhizobium sp. LNHC232B00]
MTLHIQITIITVIITFSSGDAVIEAALRKRVGARKTAAGTRRIRK